MLVDLFGAVMKVTFSVAIMRLEVSATRMQVKGSAVNTWVTIFIEIMQLGVSVAVMHVVFSTVHYAHGYSIVIMQVAFSVVAMYVKASSSDFKFLSLNDIHFS